MMGSKSNLSLKAIECYRDWKKEGIDLKEKEK